MGPQQTKVELEHFFPKAHYKFVKNNVNIYFSIIFIPKWI